MIVVFDGVCLGDGPVTGVGRAFLDGLAAYARLGVAECLLLVPAGTPDPAIPGVPAFQAPRGKYRRQFVLPKLLARLRADVLHSSVASIPASAHCRTIATLHDLPWLRPASSEPPRRLRAFLLRRLLRRASAILAPSLMTALDARRWLGGGAPEVSVVPHGANLGPPPTERTTRERRGPLLVLGDNRWRKNREAVVRAHTLARQRCADLPPLRFVGPHDDYVSEDEKRRLLRECRAVVHCSRFEGFGLPVLEGLAHGAPVLCSDLAPHREIAREHAFFVDPHSDDDIAAGLLAIHSDEPLRWRLASGGHARAAELSCASVARAWHAIHRGERP